MLTFMTYLLTYLLIVDALFLGLLILIQLPKKEAGAGMAFGGGATDALFGAGAGNALTKLTKYSAIAFFILVIGLSMLNNQSRHSNSALDLKRAMERTQTPTTSSGQPAAAAAAAAIAASNSSPVVPLSIVSKAPAAPTLTATNTPVAPVK